MASPQCVSIAALCTLLCVRTLAFKPMTWGTSSLSHGDITESAILRKTAEVCRDLALAEGRSFSLTIDDTLSASRVLRACFPDSDPSLLSDLEFKASIVAVYASNWQVDLGYTFFISKYHFDDETFVEGRSLITEGVVSVKANVKMENFFSARLTLGRVFHTLQDFYSHSNWIEMKNKVPFSALIRPNVRLENLADKGTPTCRDCVGGNCVDNILPEILSAKKMTSGYFSMFSSSKPEGKCSHGGSFDQTNSKTPVGGINKDDLSSSHGHLHQDAALVATNATVELLEDIRLAVGDVNFLRLVGISRSSVLCFVIDTTGSMSDDIEEAKRVSFSIIDSKRGTPEEPSAYILVPFNDPDFGPLTRTTDADEFKLKISALTAHGGGDEPEMCLSGLQLALTGAPPSSQIFIFTDASAKDAYLKGTVLALIEKTHSVVTFMLTNVFSVRRRRSSGIDVNQAQRFSSRMSGVASQLYQDLAQASGGQAIQVTKATLPQATNIIVDSITSALVTVFQAARDSGKSESFSFMVDESLKNLTAYITGSTVTFTLQSPSGENQRNTELNGPLGTIQAVGNLYRVELNQQVGLWTVNISSSQPYSLKVTGQSPTDFIFMFVEKTNGLREGLVLREGRPLVGKNGTLYLTVSDSATLSVTAVSLVEVSGSQALNGTVESLGRGNYLVSVNRVPEGLFSVRLVGLLHNSTRSSSTPFQRQSNTQLRASNLIVTAQANSTLEPGIPFSLPFTVANSVIGGTYTIRANDDHGVVQSFTNSLTLVNGSAQGSVILTTPENTASGTDITLTITAESPDSGDSNYAVLRLSVITKVIDFSPPVCHNVSVSANCSHNCSLSTWELSANITDGNGTGVQSVSVRRGDGILNSTSSVGEGGVNVTEVLYSASCCSPDAELIAVDNVGNVGTCFYSVRTSSDPPPTPSGTTENTTITSASTESTAPPMTNNTTVTPNKASYRPLTLTPWMCLLVSLIATLLA